MNYDLMLSDAKAALLEAVAHLGRNDRQNKPLCDGEAERQVACAVDELNKAWDRLTDALIRQRDERDRQIVRLINELAEARRAG
jgi:hypothetical protein